MAAASNTLDTIVLKAGCASLMGLGFKTEPIDGSPPEMEFRL
jgi:hypothetical protein